MDKYKVLQVGCGNISNAWLDVLTLRNDVTIAGLVDIKEENAQHQKRKYQLDCCIYTDHKEAVRALKPDIVIDNTLPSTHKDVVVFALENGCNVFGEKPISDSFEDALEMVRKSNEVNRSYSVMQNRRFLKKIREFEKIISSDLIGKLGFLKADFFLDPHFGGFRETMKSPLLLDMAIHTFDQARFISNAEPVSVYCHEFNIFGSWFDGDASACCIFEMSDDIVFTYNGSWTGIGKNTSWESEWRALGSKGSVIWDGKKSPEFENGADSKLFELIWDHPERHAGCINEMFTALKAGRPAETDCRDNIKSFAMVIAALKSAEEKRKVDIREMLF